MNRSLSLVFGCILAGVTACADGQHFPDKLKGTWTGVMMIHKEGVIRDSVKIRLTISGGATPSSWGWKTEYLSERMPVTKDYTLRLVDSAKQTYAVDEGDGIVLMDYLFANKLYGVFETGGIMLTSSYEWREPELIFEVTSGRRIPGEGQVTNYSVQNLQRAILKRTP